MSRFKEGDVIVRTGKPFVDVKPGDVLTVFRDPTIYGLRFEGKSGTYDESQFELYVPPAVAAPATVDKKESNPKEAIGSIKLNYSLVPDTLVTYACQAYSEGAYKYGAYNWRYAGVKASTYYSALNRHIRKWWNGEDFDPKTKVHHLANAIACLGIILDARVCGKLDDDRPPRIDLNKLIEESEAVTAHLREMNAGLTPPQHYTQSYLDSLPK